jgi:3-oxoacyl-[acyl-carrier-protein] synthase-3
MSSEGAMSYGVVAMGHVLGEPVDVAAVAADYTTDLPKIAAWGYRRFHRAPDGVGLTDLAAGAGRLALERAGLAPADLDLVVLTMSDIAEHLYWDAAAATQARLGAYRAEAVLLNQACGSGVAGFDTVAGKLATHPGYDTALILAANRVCDAYWNRMEATTSISSDGAAAAVVVRDHPSCRWLSTATITDGRYADFFRLSAGGAAAPFRPGDEQQARVANPFDRLDHHFGGDHRAMLRFVETIGARTREVLERACAQAGVPPSSVARVLHQNENVRALTELAAELGIPLDRTNADLAVEHGHFGCADQLFCLERYLDAGALVPGDLVALTSTGSGMHWVCTLVRV